jgi:competence/damage-inducible protein CinA-like protein
MRVEVLSVGTELLLGDIVNTNAAEIGAMLAGVGIDCTAHVSVGDNVGRIAAAIRGGIDRADAIIITGGLGPTQDDVSREAIAEVTGRPLVIDEAIADRIREIFRRMGREMAPSNLRQAERPEGSAAIEQVIGTAPGLVVEHASKVIYAIPGVPSEMREMMQRAVLPDLVRRSGATAVIRSRVLRVVGVSESQIATTLAPVWQSLEGTTAVTMAYLAGGGEVRVRLTAKAADAAAADAALAPVEGAVRSALGPAVAAAGDEMLEHAVGRLLRSRGWTIAIAESLTAGLATARLANVAGSSDYLRGAVVAYATDVKASMLGVDEELLKQHGPISDEVAAAMAAGVRTRLGAEVGLALTGVAGPQEADGILPGTVHLAVDGPLGGTVRAVRMPGDRQTVRTLAAAAGLNLVRLYLLEAL